MLALKRQSITEQYRGLFAANATAGNIGPLRARWPGVEVADPGTSVRPTAFYGQALLATKIGYFAKADTGPLGHSQALPVARSGFLAQGGLQNTTASTTPTLELAEIEGWEYVSCCPASNVSIIGTGTLTGNVGFMALTVGKVDIPTNVAQAVTFSAEIGTAGLGWLIDQDSIAEVSIPQLSALYAKIHEWLKQQSFSIVDELLMNANPARLPVAAGVALLRYSFLARARLLHWEPFLNRVKADLKSRNMDSKRLLVGLSVAE